jgi:CO/xanthine dehydrogenase FAD-binding subunit
VTVTSYSLPGSLAEALDLLGRHGPELLVMAGGTVAMPLINEGISLPGKVMGLRRAGLDTMERAGDELRIGSTVTLTRLLEQDDVPLLRRAASRTASWSIRNMGTVGGNLFTPPPGGDVATALLALDAAVVMEGPGGARVVPLSSFLTGFMTNDLRPDELVTSVRVPVEAGQDAFIKLGRRQSNTPAVVAVAVHLVRDGERVTRARIALGAAGPHPVRALAAEAILRGTTLDAVAVADAAAAAARDSEPFTDAVASAWYRRRMVEVVVKRALSELAAPGAGREA